MAWVKLDDEYPEHPKVQAAGPLAAWLDVAGICYCNRLLTDGFIPASQVPKMAPGGAKLALKLVEVGRWSHTTRHGAAGFLVHDYHVYQPSKDVVLADRKATADRQARWRAARKKRNGGSNAVTRKDVTP